MANQILFKKGKLIYPNTQPYQLNSNNLGCFNLSEFN